MANKKYDEQDGIWRTVGGRRIFIKEGQDLKSAMVESGKFGKTRTQNKNRYKAKYDKRKLNKALKENIDRKKESEYKLYKRAKENPDSITPMEENSTDWEKLEKEYSGRYNKEKNIDKFDKNEIKKMDKNINNVREKASNEYKPFEKEKVDFDKVKERCGLDDDTVKECIKYAEQKYNETARLEPKITEDLTRIAEENGGKMYGLDFRMKQPTSMAGKIGSDLDENRKYGGDKSLEDITNGIKDSLRYTVVFNNDNFYEGYNNVKSSLEKNGYKEVRTKNFWQYYKDGKSDQKAIQCIYEKDGFLFEYQYHTYESQGIKDLNHPLYEEARNKVTSEDRRKELNGIMRKRALYISNPDGVYDIEDYDRTKKLT